MNSIYVALTGNYSDQGIKNIDVFYDSLFINLKVNNTTTQQNAECVLIEKLLFNYDTNSISSDKNYIICFGNTEYSEPYKTVGNGFIRNILVDSNKTVLVCGLSTFSTVLTTYAGSETISGTSLMPLIYEYNINTSDLYKIYPKTDTDILNWSTFVIGKYIPDQTPIVFFSNEYNKLNYTIKTTLSANTKLIHSINKMIFNYSNNNISVNSIQQLTSLSSNNNFTGYDIKVGAFINPENTILISTSANKAQMFNLS